MNRPEPRRSSGRGLVALVALLVHAGVTHDVLVLLLAAGALVGMAAGAGGRLRVAVARQRQIGGAGVALSAADRAVMPWQESNGASFRWTPPGSVVDHPGPAQEPAASLLRVESDSCDVLLAVIGPHWLNTSDQAKSRLDDPKDFVRMEIALALKRPVLRVVPLLVEGGRLPAEDDLPDDLKPLVLDQALELRDDSRWTSDVQLLIEYLENLVNPAGESDHDSQAPEAKLAARTFINGLFGGAIGGGMAGLIAGWFYRQANSEVDLWRVLLAGLFGVLVGAIETGFINWGMQRCSGFFNGSSYSKILGALTGGIPGGVVSAVTAGLLFMNLAGDPVSNQLLWVIAFSPTAIGLGILLQDLRQSWIKAGMIIIILAGILVLTVIVGERVLPDDRLLNSYFQDSTTSKQIMGLLMLGLVFGAVSGLQVGLTLFAYDRVKRFVDSQ